ncbi:MAG: hypothetical protein R8K53_07465 [Mariprofundaceae bacterium]
MPKYIDLLRSHSGVKNNPVDAENPSSQDNLKHLDNEGVSPQSQSKKGKKTSKPEKKPNPGKWLKQCAQLTLSLLEASARGEKIRTTKLCHHLQLKIEAIVKDGARLSPLELNLSENTQRIRDINEAFGGMVEKSMNMLLLSIKIGLQLRMTSEQIFSLQLAAILHHIGLAKIPMSIRQKSIALTREERQTIRDAMHSGVDYLRDCGISDEETLHAIDQSQERMDGSGPMHLKGSEISYMARIVGLLSFFEAMVHYRPYRQRMLPRDAIREIILHHKTSFDIAILKALIDAVSLYPIGTYVQLNSGDIGQVIHVHPRLPLRPTIILRMDRHRHPITAREIDLQIQTTLQVEKCMYPEDLEHAA